MKLDQFIRKNKWGVSIVAGLIILVALYMGMNDMIPMATTTPMSVAGLAFAGISLGTIFLVMGAIFVFISLVKKRSGGRPEKAFHILGWVMMISGGLMSGSAIFAQLLDFIKGLGVLGYLIAFIIILFFVQKIAS